MLRIVYKPVGLTPLQVVKEYKRRHHVIETVSYAGRLDPMAEGLLLLLVGDEENKRRRTYERMDKTYEVEILFGLGSDSDDLLGMGEKAVGISHRDLEEKLPQVVTAFIGEIDQIPPVMSAHRIGGKPLFSLVRQGCVPALIATKKVNILNITLLGLKQRTGEEILCKVHDVIPRITGDFRQGEVVKHWEKIVSPRDHFLTACLRVSCGSGTFMRALARDIGTKLTTRALAYSIRRTRIGQFCLL
jgi:tRNA pseudouridine55 synthase